MAARRRWPRDPRRERFWRGVLRRQADSGSTVRDFCAAENLPESAFYFWRREIQRRNQERSARARPPRSRRTRHTPSRSVGKTARTQPQPSVFVPVEIAPLPSGPNHSARLEVVLPCGAKLQVPCGFDRGTLASVVDVLETRRC